jgi:hypothetical protein
MMTWQAPPLGTCKSNSLTRKMNQKGDGHLKRQTRASFAAPLYAPIP